MISDLFHFSSFLEVLQEVYLPPLATLRLLSEKDALFVLSYNMELKLYMTCCGLSLSLLLVLSAQCDLFMSKYVSFSSLKFSLNISLVIFLPSFSPLLSF